ncbi:MAG: NAD(P)-dependent oxidoreductase [Patescibacteria group bacterium]
MSRQKILVYGITGMTGTRFAELVRDKFKIIGPPRFIVDLTNKKQVKKNIRDVSPDQILYLAGITKVDEAQQNPKNAYLLNSEAVKYAAKESALLNIPFHYVSTDAVFDGKLKNRLYKENDKTNPISIYGKSKLAGEKVVLEFSNKNSVIRTIMIYSPNYPHKKDFAKFAYESLKYKKPITGIIDQFINPTYVDDLVNGICKILQKRESGIYHVAATDSTTNFEFLKKIEKTFKFNKNLITETTFNEFFKDKTAPRQQYSRLSTEKFRKKFGNGILHKIDQGINEFKKQMSKLETQPIDV